MEANTQKGQKTGRYLADNGAGDCYDFPVERFEEKYHGCGHGWVEIDKATDTPVEMSYSLNPNIIERKQNAIVLSALPMDENPDGIVGGDVLKETDDRIWLACSISCWTACLF